MRRSLYALGASALAPFAYAQTNGNYCDDLGRCYASHTTSNGIVYGVAIPETTETGFDLLLQITAPTEIGWAAVAWGGSMTYNPLSVAWPNGENVVISSRAAVSYSLPAAYGNAAHTILDGSYVNETHWVVTAFCRGCSEWADLGSYPDTLNPGAANTMGFAYSSKPVDAPEDEDSTFAQHDDAAMSAIDLSTAQSADFGSWVPENPNEPEPTDPAPTTTVPPPTTTSAPPPDPTGPIPVPTSCNLESIFPLEVAEGWSFVKVAGDLTTPRGLTIDSEGHLLMVEVGKGLSVHTFGADGCIASSKLLIDNPRLTHGVALNPGSTQLFVSSIDTAWRYTYDASAQTVSGQETVVAGMFPSSHSTRTLLVPPGTPDLLVVSIGSDTNLDMPSLDKAVGRALVKVFDMTAVPADGYDYSTTGSFLGYGLRNEVGLAVDNNNMIWGVENSADEFARTVDGVDHDIHEENPADELNYLGDPSVANEKWYGYPTCFTVWGGEQFPDGNPATGSQFIPAPNATFSDATCEEQSVGPRLSFQSHSAPIDAKFDRDGANLFVSLHGSWNRDTPSGYKVVAVPFTSGDAGYEPVAAADSREGYQDLLWDPQEGCDSSKCFRPSGLTFDLEFTRLFIASDNSRQGELYILTKTA